MEKKIVYVDMDNVLVNFKSALTQIDQKTKDEYTDPVTGKENFDEIPGIFSLMDINKGAKEAITRIREMGYDLYILSTAPWKNPSAWSDKLKWVQQYFGAEKDDVFYKRIILSHHKNLCIGDYLIDDRTANGAGEFEGTLIQFDKEHPEEEWTRIVKFLEEQF